MQLTFALPNKDIHSNFGLVGERHAVLPAFDVHLLDCLPYLQQIRALLKSAILVVYHNVAYPPYWITHVLRTDYVAGHGVLTFHVT